MQTVTTRVPEAQCRECFTWTPFYDLTGRFCSRCVREMTADGRWCATCDVPRWPTAPCLGCEVPTCAVMNEDELHSWRMAQEENAS